MACRATTQATQRPVMHAENRAIEWEHRYALFGMVTGRQESRQAVKDGELLGIVNRHNATSAADYA